MRHLFRIGSLGCLVGSLLATSGCSDRNKADVTHEAKSATKISESPAVTKALDDSKATYTLATDGSISQVTFRNGAKLTDALAAELLKLKNLQSLVVAEADLTADGWKTVGQLKSLSQLDLRDVAMGNDELKAAVTPLKQLITLRLSGKSGATTVDDTGMEALQDNVNLKVLAVDFLWIGDAGLAHLAKVKDLRELYMAGSLVDDTALERIGKIASLKKLRLARTNVSKAGLTHLQSLKLEDIDLSECSLVDDSALEAVGKITSLKKLNLWRDAVGDEGVKFLADLKQLQWLNLDNTQITDASTKVVSGFTNLTFLHLGSTAVSNAGIAQLTTLKALKDLKVTRTSVTDEGAAELKKSLPSVEIQIKYRESEEAP